VLPWLQPFHKIQNIGLKIQKFGMIFKHGRKAAKRHPLKLYSEMEVKVKFFFFHAVVLPVAHYC